MATPSPIADHLPIRRVDGRARVRWLNAAPSWKVQARAWLTAPRVAPWNLGLSADFPDTPMVTWYGPAGERGAGALADLPAAARAAPLRVWTPPIETLLMTAPWPGGRRARLAQALPYLLEEQLLMEPELLDFSYHETTQGIAVAITSRARLSAWRAAFAERGLAARFCPLSLALPWAPGTWSCRYSDGQWAVRTGLYSGFGAVGRVESPPPALIQALADAEAAKTRPVALTLIEGDEALRAMLAQALAVTVTADRRLVGDLDDLPFALGESQGALAAAGRSALRSVRPALLALGLWLVLGLAHTTYQWVTLNHALTHLQAEQAQVFSASFPMVPILDAPTQMRVGVAKLAAATGQGGAGFLGLVTAASTALAALPAGSLTGLQYHHGSLAAVVRVDDFPALTALDTALAAGGLTVKVGQVVSRKDGVRAHILLRRAS
ncbi:MAG: type II secretion system protein GspL [Acidiferrobacter sp.]